MTFKQIGIIDPILKALDEQGYSTPTPIQQQSIPILLESSDMLGCAQTGTGKTAAFGIPILQHIFNNKENSQKGHRKIKALIVTPTRELAIQIGDSFKDYGKHTGIKQTVIFGGVKQGSQTNALRAGVEILVATPGRLLDLMQQGFISLKDIEYFVLDEADQMLDMGFVHDIKKIIAKLPQKRQSLFFSATMPENIVALSKTILKSDYKSITIRPEQATADKVEQSLYFVSKKDKPNLLKQLLEESDSDAVLVFTRTKHGADKVVRILEKSGINAAAIHGNKSQNARQRALNDFKDGKLHVLIATDIAARGIDVSQLELVINFDLPNIPETYVHRIGRTGRANESGISVSFCDMEERPYLKDIEKLIKQKVPVIKNHPFAADAETEVVVKKKQQQRPPRGSSNRGGQNKPSQGGSSKRNNSSSSKNSKYSGRRG